MGVGDSGVWGGVVGCNIVVALLLVRSARGTGRRPYGILCVWDDEDDE
jgi:hypothetical protein